jgi:hypothetical protein
MLRKFIYKSYNVYEKYILKNSSALITPSPFSVVFYFISRYNFKAKFKSKKYQN